MKKGEYTKYQDFQDILAAKTKSEGDCKIWTAGCHAQGYPMVRWEGKMVQVVRHLVAENTGIELRRDHRVRNTVCGNVKCCNPDHYQVFERGTLEWGKTKRWTSYEEKQRLRDLWFSQSEEEQEAWGSKKRFAKKHNLNPATLDTLINNAFILYDLK